MHCKHWTWDFFPSEWTGQLKEEIKINKCSFQKGGLETMQTKVNVYQRLQQILWSTDNYETHHWYHPAQGWSAPSSPGEPWGADQPHVLLPRRETGQHSFPAISPSSPHNGAEDDEEVWDSMGCLSLSWCWAGGCTQLLTGAGPWDPPRAGPDRTLPRNK